MLAWSVGVVGRSVGVLDGVACLWRGVASRSRVEGLKVGFYVSVGGFYRGVRRLTADFLGFTADFLEWINAN